MTKKDYIKIADILKINTFERDSNGEQIQRQNIRKHVISLIIDILEKDNASFDRTKFIEYINANN